jgi:hypothetical protein
VTSAASEHFLVVVERLRIIENGTGSTQLLILNPETGAVRYRLKGEFDDLSASGDYLMVLEGAGGPGQARLYTCSLPECGRNPGLLLTAKEILRFQVHGDYILTWGIYDAACFSRTTGKRLWQKGQIDWSEPFGSEMIAADFSFKGSTARIVSINLQTGAERVLFARRVTKKDKTLFRPF